MRRPFLPLLPLVVAFLVLGSAPATAATDADTAKKTLYGMFRQAADGALNFIDAQEPGVIYIPFDATAIMSDDLNIKVQVQGSVVESFTRGGTTYRILAVKSIKPLTSEYGATTITPGQHPGLPGTEAATVHAYANKTCVLYDRYAVLEHATAYANGASLRVLARTPGDNPDAVCEALEGRPVFKISNGDDFTFAGLSGDTLFVQNGQADAVHGLMAVNLVSQKQILNATVIPGATVAGGVLRYTEQVAAGKTKLTCPAGKTAVRDMRLVLQTGRTEAVGKVVCR